MQNWWINPKIKDPETAEAFKSLEKVFSLTGEMLSEGNINNTFKLQISDKTYFVKLYFRGGRRLRRWFGTSRLYKEWLNLKRFEKWQFNCPEIVAFGIQKFGPVFIRGALITAEVPTAQDLLYLQKHKAELFENEEWFDSVSTQVADATRIMHEKSFAHGDLKWRNILVSEGKKPQVYFFDCPMGGFWKQPFLNYRIIKDLACLDKVGNKILSKTQRLRFYLKYKNEKKLSPENKKQIKKILRFFEGRE